MKTIYRNTISKLPAFALAVIMLTASGCDSFTETELPGTQLYTDAVFEDRNTATAALTDIYARIRETGLLSGKGTGAGYMMGLYADDLQWAGTNATETAFFINNVLPATGELKGMWNDAYSRVYATNAIIEGVASSKSLSEADRMRLTGEALFIRAIEHLYLTQLWGEVPYIITTDYRSNAKAPRVAQEEIYNLLINDLQRATVLLRSDYITPERVRPNAFAAHALLARVYLYAGKWTEAANEASAVINNTTLYTWEENLNEVFLKESATTIWQLKPQSEGMNTEEGAAFIFTGTPPVVSLSNGLLDAFEPGDLRKEFWTKAVNGETGTWYHANKYKQQLTTGTSVEYSKILRLAEQYLIRSEARARQGELITALEDLNIVRHTAGLGDAQESTQDDILSAILRERRVELFTEHAHRFIDLKRYGLLDSVLGSAKPGWNTTDRLLPVPETELGLNPNLLPQNPGY
jgi:hypothetical protein